MINIPKEVFYGCNDCKEAVKKIEENNEIVLILLELRMAIGNGFHMLEDLNSKEKHKGIRAIILVDREEADYESRGLQYGTVDYIKRPLNIEALKAKIDMHMALNIHGT